jgi:poly-gamma-glutamate system protein
MYHARSLRVHLIGLAALGILALAVAERMRHQVAAPYYEEKLNAARLTALAQKGLQEERWGAAHVIDTVNDPNQSGLIGEEFTLITTDRGVLRAKLTSLNPNFAAVIVDQLKRAGFRRGDLAAIGVTGSFPALNVAVLAAVESLGGHAVSIASVGASMWGANDPSFTWLDMERVLVEKGILQSRSVAASLGGGEDRGRGLSPEGRRLIREAVRRNGVALIEEETLEESIARRMQIYDERRGERQFAVYINVGGGLASLGASENGRLVRPGLNIGLGLHNFPRKGVMILMAERGVPVIHLLDLLDLARENGLPVAPIPLPEAGEGEIFTHTQYHAAGVSLVLLIYAGLVVLVLALALREKAGGRSG